MAIRKAALMQNKFNKFNQFKQFKQFHQLPSNATNDDDDDDEIEAISRSLQYLPYFESKRINRCIKISLDESIKAPKYYRTVLQGIDSLAEDDIVLLNINSYGGQLDGAIAIINGIQNTPADVYANIEGIAASAASLIALAAPSVSVAPYASMMVHSATFGTFGKQSDVISHASFVDKQVRGLMCSIYKDFLSERELEEVIMGKEFWFDADEIISRLEVRNALSEKRFKAQQKADKAAEKASDKSKVIIQT